MTRRLLAQTGLVIAAALAAGCGKESFPVSPTPVASSAVVVQGTKYQGNITLANGATTSFNMTLIARELAGVTRVAASAANAPSITGNFETGTGLRGTVTGNLTGSLDNGFFDGSLTATSAGRAAEQRYTGPVTTTSAALAPGDCVQGTCAADGLTGAIQTVQTPTTSGPPPAPCSYALAPTAASFPGGGGTGSSIVTTAATCAWSAIPTAPWIEIVGAAAGTGVSTVSFRVQPNAGDQRTGTLQIAGQTFTVTQSSGSCSYTLTPTAQAVPAGGGSLSTSLATTCAYAASSDVPWITTGAGASGTTGGTIAYAVAATSEVSARTGHITVQGAGGSATLTVTQAATGVPIECTYSLSPATQAVAAAGGSFSTALTRASGCSGTWTASSDVPWISNISPASGTASGTIAYVVAANAGAQRTGHITVAGPGGSVQLTVIQAGQCSYTISPATQAVAAAGGSFSTALSLTSSCSGTWTAASDVPWITGIAPSSGTAGATIAYVVAANTGVQRIGHVTVTGPDGSAQLTVTQAGVCSYTLTPSTQAVAVGGGSLSTALTQTTSCSGNWTASSDVAWITGISPSTGTAGATIGYIVASNTGAQRTGHVTVTGAGGTVQLTVTQDGVPCTDTLNPVSQAVVVGGGSFSTRLTRTASCTGTWTASSDVPWISGISPNSGTADTTIAYVVAANTGAQRTGHLNVTGPGGSVQLTVTQDPLACTYTLAPATQSVGSGGGSFSTVFTRTTACTGTWTASSDVLWLIGISPSSGTAGATIAYSAQSNTGAQRVGHITVTGPGGSAMLTVTQQPLILTRPSGP